MRRTTKKKDKAAIRARKRARKALGPPIAAPFEEVRAAYRALQAREALKEAKMKEDQRLRTAATIRRINAEIRQRRLSR